MSREKFKAMVHYIVHECRDNPGRLGAVRLNKALWFTDMISYQKDGVSVTGEKYIRREKGPVPATILATIEELVAEEKILVQEPEFAYDSRKYISLGHPNTEMLSDDERESVRSILDFVCDHTTNEIIGLTHGDVWAAAAEGEEMPLFATLAAVSGEITDEARDWAETIVQEITESRV